jgi:hypothetical protein
MPSRLHRRFDHVLNALLVMLVGVPAFYELLRLIS